LILPGGALRMTSTPGTNLVSLKERGGGKEGLHIWYKERLATGKKKNRGILQGINSENQPSVKFPGGFRRPSVRVKVFKEK